MYLALITTGIVMALVLRMIEIAIGRRIHAKVSQYDLARACNKQQNEDYIKSFGMADVRTMRKSEWE